MSSPLTFIAIILVGLVAVFLVTNQDNDLEQCQVNHSFEACYLTINP